MTTATEPAVGCFVYLQIHPLCVPFYVLTLSGCRLLLKGSSSLCVWPWLIVVEETSLNNLEVSIESFLPLTMPLKFIWETIPAQ